jgi:hypothetical protein
MRKFPTRRRRGRSRQRAWLVVWSQGRRRGRVALAATLLIEGGDVLLTESGDELRR